MFHGNFLKEKAKTSRENEYRPRSAPIFLIIPIYLWNLLYFLYYLIFSFYFLYFHVSLHPCFFFFFRLLNGHLKNIIVEESLFRQLMRKIANFAYFQLKSNVFKQKKKHRSFEKNVPLDKFLF